MQAIINGLATYYRRSGTGKKTLILLHGWGDDGATFDGLAQALSQTYTVIVLDLPGFGRTQAPQEIWGIREYALFVAAFVTKITTDEPYAIIGHSNGGTIAMYILAKRLIKVQKLILLASAGIRTTEDRRRHRYVWGSIAKLGKLMTVALPKTTKQKLRAKLYEAAGSDMLIAPHMQEIFKRVVGYDIREQAARIATPSLLIYGKNDTATPVSDGILLAQSLMHSQLQKIHQAGHFVHHDQLASVTAMVEEFLR